MTVSGEDEEARTIKLDQRFRYDNIASARGSLTDKLLSAPVRLGVKKEEVHRKFGTPKEVIGFGNELYETKDAKIMVSYTSDQNGEVIASAIELRPKKRIPWFNLLKPSVKLPQPASYDPKEKKLIRITLQIRVEDIGEMKSLQITMIGSDKTVSFINWSLIL
ncbi:MAG: hypothetical protein AB1489_36155 [Acidobacteriota bacterium]